MVLEINVNGRSVGWFVTNLRKECVTMKKLTRISILFIALVLCLSMMACGKAKQEKDTIYISSSKAAWDKNDLLQRSDIVVRGKIVSKNYELMTNPDGTAKDSKGELITNSQVAEYTMEIYDIYKGKYDGDTINVMTYNGYGLEPDLILYGEDEKSILSSPIERVDYELGKECILLIAYANDVSEGYDGYYPVGGKSGYYPLDESGKYICSETNTIDEYTFSLETIEKDIADSELSLKNETAAK